MHPYPNHSMGADRSRVVCSCALISQPWLASGLVFVKQERTTFQEVVCDGLELWSIKSRAQSSLASLPCSISLHKSPNPTVSHHRNSPLIFHNSSIMASSGGPSKWRCRYFYTYNCNNWVYVRGSSCQMCIVSRVHRRT